MLIFITMTNIFSDVTRITHLCIYCVHTHTHTQKKYRYMCSLVAVLRGQRKKSSYFSKTHSKAERNCKTTMELLAIIKALEHFHKYLHSYLEWITLRCGGC